MRSRQWRSTFSALTSRAASLRAAAMALRRFSGLMLCTPFAACRRPLPCAWREERRFAQVARDLVSRKRFLESGFLDTAAIERVGAACVEAATRGHLDRARHVARQDQPLAA